MNLLLVIFYNLTILAGTALLVAEYEWSPWWFLFALVVMMTYGSKKD
jgi:hypothetical protein